MLMDEPFSALDVLTAANLRGELTRLGGPPIIPKAFQTPRVSPEPVPKPSIVQPSPKPAEPTEYAKKMADSAAQGHPSRRLPDIPDAERTKEATVGDVIDAVEEIFDLPKIKPDSDGTQSLGRDF